ncbi:MAG: DMT family transporter [Gammaproteobacteria bacterium]|nr:DMT family transporter [Gammaproteobacteria bacterium]
MIAAEGSVTRRNVFQASLLVAISGILYGFLGFLGTRVLNEQFSLPAMLFWRFLIAGIWMSFFVVKKYSFGKTNPPVNKSVLWFMFFIGAIGYAGSSGFYFVASQYTGTGLAMVIFFSYPIMVACLSFAKQREKINLATVLTLSGMMLGLFLLKGDTSSHSLSTMGILFGLMAAAFYACYVVGSKRASSVLLDSELLTMMLCFGSALIFLIASILSHGFSFPSSWRTAVYLGALGIFATALPIQLMLEGLKYISSIRASIISVLEPLVTVCVGVGLLHESISHLQILGALIVLMSTLFIQFERNLSS